MLTRASPIMLLWCSGGLFTNNQAPAVNMVYGKSACGDGLPSANFIICPELCYRTWDQPANTYTCSTSVIRSQGVTPSGNATPKTPAPTPAKRKKSKRPSRNLDKTKKQ